MILRPLPNQVVVVNNAWLRVHVAPYDPERPVHLVLGREVFPMSADDAQDFAEDLRDAVVRARAVPDDGSIRPKQGGTCFDQDNPTRLHRIVDVSTDMVTTEARGEGQDVLTSVMREWFDQHWKVLT
jgi:hypothetical protein